MTKRYEQGERRESPVKSRSITVIYIINNPNNNKRFLFNQSVIFDTISTTTLNREKQRRK